MSDVKSIDWISVKKKNTSSSENELLIPDPELETETNNEPVEITITEQEASTEPTPFTSKHNQYNQKRAQNISQKNITEQNLWIEVREVIKANKIQMEHCLTRGRGV